MKFANATVIAIQKLFTISVSDQFVVIQLGRKYLIESQQVLKNPQWQPSRINCDINPDDNK